MGKGQATSDYPKQADNLEINEVADGYIVYQPERDRVHYLNHTAALVLTFCTGGNRADEIPHLLKQAFDLPKPPAAEVRDCLAKFVEEGLVR
jgi:hypothetical protein